MDTLQKRLSEIRDLRAEELDLVGGAGEGFGGYGTMTATYATFPYNTWSMMPAAPGTYSSQVDDGTVQTMAVDTNWD